MKITIEYPDDMDIRDATQIAHDVTTCNSFMEGSKLMVGVSDDNSITALYKHTGARTRKVTLKWTDGHGR